MNLQTLNNLNLPGEFTATESGVNHSAKDPIPLYEAKPGQEVMCRIKCLTDSYMYDINGYVQFTPRGSGGSPKLMMFPYFGGNQPAPQDMSFSVKYIK